jgi:hypothetical protein
MEILVALGVAILILLLLFKGVIQTFQRQAIVAILCLIFLFPIYLIWVIIEFFFLDKASNAQIVILKEKD